MQIYIVDASVVVNSLFFPDSSIAKTFKARMKKKNNSWKSTQLLPLEVGNSIRYATRDEKFADEQFEKFKNLPIESIELNSRQYRDSLHLSYAHQTTVYDTSYHVLALDLDATFLTCDKQYFDRAKHLGNIELLSTD